MKVGQRLAVIQEPRLRHQVSHHVACADCPGLKRGEVFGPESGWGVCRIVDEELLDPCRPVSGWHPGEGEVAVRLEMPSRFFERCAAFLVDQPGRGVAPGAFRIGDGRPAVGFDMQRPAGAEPAEEIVHACGDGDQFLRGRTFKVRAAIRNRALEAAILVEDDAGRDQAGPFEMVGERSRAGAIFTKVQHA